MDTLPRPSGGSPDINQRGISVRLEAIDALETHFEGAHQELAGANAARDELLRALGFTGVTFFPELPNTVESADQDRVRGHVLSNGIDANGRVIGFVEPGEATEPDGAQVFVDEARARRSVNAALLADGLAYPALYSTLPASLRAEFAQTARAARAAGAGHLAARDRGPGRRGGDRGPRGARGARPVAEAVPPPRPVPGRGRRRLRRVRRVAARRPGQP